MTFSPPRGETRRSWQLVVAALALSVPTSAHGIWPFDQRDESLAESANRVLSQAIQISSVNPPGDEAALAAYLVEVADDAGLDARLVPTPNVGDDPSRPYDGGKKARRAAAWARLSGTGEARPIVLLSHLDVVPADPREWSTPPFEGRIEDGYVIGRGALDAKGVAVIQLMALVELSKRDVPLTRDVIWLATPDEETGGELGAGYLVAHHDELLGGAEFVLTEGGHIRSATEDTPSVWGVAVTEKSPCWLELTARGPAGHTSAPAPDAAVPRLVAALSSVRRIETQIQVLPEVQRMFHAMARSAAPEDRDGYRNLSRALAEDGRFRRRFLSNRGRNALVRNTVSITVLEGATRTNVAPARARAHLDVRLLPGQRCEDFAHAVANVVAGESVTVEILLEFETAQSPIDTPLYRAIRLVAAQMDPHSIVVPRMTAGFTDAHYFRSAGMVTYGFVPRWLSASDTRGIHGANERVSTRNLVRGTETLVAILEELAAPASE